MRTRLKSLFLLVVAIAMAMPCLAEGIGDKLEVMDNTYNLIFQVVDPSKHTVTAMATAQTIGEVVVPATVKDAKTQGTITYSVVSVDRFSVAEKMTKVTLSEGIEEIAKGCFSRCSSLEEVNIPASVTTIGDGVFATCEKLAKITVPEENQNYAVQEDVLYNKDKTKIIYYPQGKTEETVTLASTLKEVGGACFSGNKSLKKIILPTELEKYDPTAIDGCTNFAEYEIGDEAINYMTIDGLLCTKIAGTDECKLVSFPIAKTPSGGEAYNVPDAITQIGKYAFYQCGNLRGVKLNKVKVIEELAFYRSGLTKVEIPAGADNVSSDAFNESTLLASITVEEGSTHYTSVDGVLFNDDKTTLLTYPIGKSGDDYLDMPSTVTTIAKSAFHACRIKKVKLAESVKTIEEGAFSYSSLEEVELNEGLETINQGAFSVTDLSTVHIPASVKNINRMAFYKLNSGIDPKHHNTFTSVTVADGSQLDHIIDAAFGSNANLKSFTFEGSTTLNNIGANVFNDCSSLSSFEVPASVTQLYNGAFNGCTALVNITFDENSQLKSIGKQAFQNCTSLPQISLPASVVSIGQEAFNKCGKLEQIDIPTATNNIHYSAFQFCDNLTNINVDGNNKTYSSVDGMLASKDQKTLVIFPAGKANDKITLLSPAFTAIGPYAFYDCQKLTNVTISKHVTKIDNSAFGLCDNLNTIAFLGDVPTSIAQKTGAANDPYSFLGTANTDILAKCTICVRSDKKEDFEKEHFWKSYASNIISSFKVENKNYQDGDGNNEYEEYFPMSDNAVSLLTTTSTAHTVVIPASVTTMQGGTEKVYNVNMIGDYAFEGVPASIKEVVLQGNIIYIGSWAFNTAKHTEESSVTPTVVTTPQIENIFFVDKNQTSTELSTKRFGLDAANFNGMYNEFLDGQHIYVRKSVKEKAEETWGQYKDKLEYQIPLNPVGTNLTTLSREFDVDLSENNWNEQTKSPNAIAFITGYKHPVTEYVKDDKGELVKNEDGSYQTKVYYQVHMESINVNNGEDGVQGNGNGTFIPKNTGVLIKNVNSTGLSGFTYQIYDGDALGAASADNLMRAVVEREGTMQKYNYLLTSDDKLHMLSKSDTRTVNVHESYMVLPEEAQTAGAKLRIIFGDDENSSTTGIEDIVADTQMDNEAYYTLQGIKVEHPVSGIYIHAGKKVVVK